MIGNRLQFFTLALIVCLLAPANVHAANVESKIARFKQLTGQKFISIANLKVAVWQPDSNTAPMPLVIFSHGFHGRNTQSNFLMVAMAKAGYLVMAPDHDDATALGAQSSAPPDVPFKMVQRWNANTYRQRGQDIKDLIAALHASKEWNPLIDWSKVALCGHSLGGYTVLGLAGAWPSWKIGGVKAVLALSPFCAPYNFHDTLSGVDVPVMYEGGTTDFGITPSVKRKGGAFDSTNSPAYFVEFEKMNHMGWTGYNQNPESQELVDYYSLAFLDRYVKGDKSINLQDKRAGVAQLLAK